MLPNDVLRIRPFRDLWLGQAISQLGDAFYYFAFMFMVKKVTGSDAMVGYVAALETLPFLLIGPYAGVLADRIDRRRIMLLSDVLSAGALLSFGLATCVNGSPPLWSLFVTPAILSSVRAFFMPAKNAAIPALVPGDKLMAANALSMATQNFMFLISLGVAGTIVSALYAISKETFLLTVTAVNTFSFLLSAYFIARLPRIAPDRTHATEAHPWLDLKEGLRYLKRRPELTMLISLGGIVGLFVSPFFVIYIAANDAWFGGRPEFLAWCEFGFFAGMIVASSWVGKLNLQRPGVGYVWGSVLVGLTIALMAFSKVTWLFVLWNVVAGLGLPFAQIPTSTYLQASVPDAFRGRVTSVLTTVSMGVMPIGQLMGGLLVQNVGLVASFLIMGLGIMAAGAIGFLSKPFWNMAMPKDEPVIVKPAIEPLANAG